MLNSCTGSNIVDDRWFNVEAVTVITAAARENDAAFVNPFFDITKRIIKRSFINDRGNISVAFRRQADLEGICQGNDLFHEFIVDLFIDDQPYELDEVRRVHAHVLCFDAAGYQDLLALPRMNPRFITVDSVNRRRMYVDEQRRKADQIAFKGPEQKFLESLGMRYEKSIRFPGDDEDVPLYGWTRTQGSMV